MEDEVSKGLVKNMKQKEISSKLAVSMRVMIPVFVFLWIMHSGFELATQPKKFAAFAAWTFQIGTSFAFYIGIVTMLFGFLALILGLPIIADLCLNLLEQVQLDADKPRGKSMFSQTSFSFAVNVFI